MFIEFAFPNLRTLTEVTPTLACTQSVYPQSIDAAIAPFEMVNGSAIVTFASCIPVMPEATALLYVTPEFHHSSTVPSDHFL